MKIKNTSKKYGRMAVLLHWLMAALIIGLLIIGLYMTSLPAGLEKSKFYGWHKEFGLTVLTLALFRLGWRMSNITPQLSLPIWEKFSARSMHWLLYVLMVAMPITGWCMSSAAGFRVSFFGLFTLPLLIHPDENLSHLFANLHEWLAYLLIACIIIHTAAAFKHHFIDKDDILRRMV